jgi:hypothetical protein
MSAKHTPGPWGFRPFPAYGYGIVASDNPQGRESFAVVHFADSARGRTTEQAKADAHLIAAAPMLLEVLQDCLTAMTALHCGSVSKADIVESARSAIAQATGEKP